MHLQTLRIIADACRDDRNGVNAQLAALQRDPYVEDRQPPAVTAILDPTTNRTVAKGELPADSPLLVIALDGESALPSGAVQQQRRDANIPIGIWYATRVQDEDRAVVDTLYTLHAVLEVINWLSLPAQEAARQRGRVQVRTIQSMTWGLIDPYQIKTHTMTGKVSVLWGVRDHPTLG